jgi:hypothetical protein
MRLFYYLSLFLIPFIVYLFSVLVFIYADGFYSVVENDASFEEQNHMVFSYIRGTNDALPIEFQEKEFSHLLDVRKFVISLQYFFVICSLLLSICLYYAKTKSLKYGGYGVLGVSGLFILMGIFFRFSFDMFHRLFFEPGTYSFSYDYLIIKIYTEMYFLQSFLFIVFFSSCIGLVLVYHDLIFSRSGRYKGKSSSLFR